jgi:hypothetical protein
LRLFDTIRLHDPDPMASNTADDVHRVIPGPIADASFAGAQLTVALPPLSWNVFRFSERPE